MRGRGFGGVGLLWRVGGSRGGVEVGDLEEKSAGAAGVLALLLGEQGSLGGVADRDAARGLGVVLDHAGQSVDRAGKQSDGGDAGAGRGEGFEFVDVALGSGFCVLRAEVGELKIQSHGDLVDREVGSGEELEERGRHRVESRKWRDCGGCGRAELGDAGARNWWFVVCAAWGEVIFGFLDCFGGGEGLWGGFVRAEV